MAHATKYLLEWATPTADCRLSLQQDGWGGGVTDLAPSPEPFEITWSQQDQEDLTLPLKVSTARIRFFGDAEGELVQEVFDAGDTEWRVLFERDPGGGFSEEWRGFLATDLWRDNPHVDYDVVELEAIDGLALLENRDFAPGGTPLLLYTYMRNILRDLHELPVSANMEWYPYREGDQLLADELPIGHMSAATNAFDELEPIEGEDGFETTGQRSERRVLEAILERFGMELFQSRGEWTTRQRSQIQSDGTIKTWPSATAINNENPTTRDLSRSLPRQYSSDRPRGRVERLRTVESVHSYDGLGELVRNGSFEASGGGFESWTTEVGGAQTLEVQDYDNTSLLTSASQENTYVAHIQSGDQSALPKIEQELAAVLHDAGPNGAYNVSWEMASASPDVGGEPIVQVSIIRDGSSNAYLDAVQVDLAGEVESASDGRLPLASSIGGSGDVVVIPEGSTLPVYKTTGGPEKVGEITLSEPAYGGDTVLKGSIPSDIPFGDGEAITYWQWVLGETDTNPYTGATSGEYLEATADFPDFPASQSVLRSQEIYVPQRTPTGTIVLGDLNILLSVNEVTGPNDTQSECWFDGVSAQITVGQDPVDQTSYIALDNQFGTGIEISQVIGDGPTANHPKGIQLDGVDVTRDWQVGPYASGDPRSGQLIEEVTAEAAMRQQRQTLDRRTITVVLRDNDEVWPQDVFDIGGTPYTVSYLRRVFSHQNEAADVELTQLKDSGTSGLQRAYSMSSESADGGGGGGTTFVGSQTVEGASSWDELNNKPTGLFAQNGASDGYSETIAPTYDTSGPSAKGPLFTGAGEDVIWQRDPDNDIALEVRDTTNGNRLLWLDDNGRLHTRRDQEAFADGAGSAAPGTNSLLQVEDEGSVLTGDAASINFTGSAVSATASGDDVTVDISGGGSPTDILEGGSEVVSDATDIDFNASQFNVTDEGSSEAGVALEGEFIDDRANALLTAGSGISLSYDDPGNSLTITNTGTSSTAGEFSGVEATRDTTLSVSSGSATIIDWDGELFDTDSYHSTSTNTSRLTVPNAGKYLIGGTIEFAAWATLSDGRLQVRLFKNGAFIRELIDNEVDSSGGDGPSYSFQTVVDAAQGDYFELSVLQASGGSRDLTTNSVFYASRLQGSGPSALPDLNDVDSATQTNGNVLASGGGNYRGESLSSMWSDHVSPIGSSDIAADAVGPAEVDSTTGTAYDIDISGNAATAGDADTLDGVEGSGYAQLNQDETITGLYSFRGASTDGQGDPVATFEGGDALERITLYDEDTNNNLGPRIHGKAGNPTVLSGNGPVKIVADWSGTPADVFYADQSGNVGLAGITAPSYAVEVGGDVRSTGEQEAFLGSDRRLKHNPTPIGGALNKVCQIGGYGFQWHDEDAVQPHKRGEQDVGVIAQEVAEVCPEAVTEFGGGHSEGYKAVNYDRLVPLLIEAVKDLRSQVDALR